MYSWATGGTDVDSTAAVGVNNGITTIAAVVGVSVGLLVMVCRVGASDSLSKSVGPNKVAVIVGEFDSSTAEGSVRSVGGAVATYTG